VVLENESGPCLGDLVTQHTPRFAPADGVEFGMIEEMAAAIADAFAELAASPELNLLYRYKTRLHRIYQRALYNLASLGERVVPNEPSPIFGHPGAGPLPALPETSAHPDSAPSLHTPDP
jgi:hypothetical protein